MPPNKKSSLPLLDNGKAIPLIKNRFFSRIPKKLLFVPVVVLLIGIGGIVGMYFQPPGLQMIFKLSGWQPGGGTATPIAVPFTTTDILEINTQKDVMALGRIMPQGDIITVAAPYGSGDARIAKILVKEGQELAVGDIISELDNLDTLVSSHNLAIANLNVAEAELEQVKTSISTTKKEAEAKLASSEAAYLLAKKERIRAEELYKRFLIPKTELDQAELSELQASRDLQQTEATLSRLQGGKQQSDISLSTRKVELAEIELAKSAVDLKKGYVISPKDGVLINLHVKEGERPSNSGVATIGSTNRMQAEIEIYQTDISKIRLGQSVSLNSSAIEDSLHGFISEIGLEVERQTIIDKSPASNTDARIIRVIADLDEGSSSLAKGLTGLQVTARIEETIE